MTDPHASREERDGASEPLTTAKIFSAIREHRSYHDARRTFLAFGNERPFVSRAEYAEDRRLQRDATERRESLGRAFLLSPGPFLDALALGTEEERDVAIRLIEAAWHRLYDIANAG